MCSIIISDANYLQLIYRVTVTEDIKRITVILRNWKRRQNGNTLESLQRTLTKRTTIQAKEIRNQYKIDFNNQF